MLITVYYLCMIAVPPAGLPSKAPVPFCVKQSSANNVLGRRHWPDYLSCMKALNEQTLVEMELGFYVADGNCVER